MDGGGSNTSAVSIYNLFVDIARDIKPNYLSMIMPARWYSGGKGLDDFRESMLSDKRIQRMVDYPNPKNCFPTANISGGICYFLWNKNYIGNCEYTNVVNSERISSTRQLDEHDVFVRYNKALPIIEKVLAISFESLMGFVSARNVFNLDSSIRGLNNRKQSSDVTVYSSRGIGYLPLSDIKSGIDSIHQYKVFMGKVLSGHIGETDANGKVKVIATIQTANPNDVCTDSYLVIGGFETKEEAINLENYIKTKTLRFLLLQSLTSMNISRGNFRFVPLQDFTKPWTDDVLYAKYGFTDEEIKYIDSMIKPME
jgi:hypothetical protein